jgi:DNA-binding transcriptional LysR family regulator
MKPRPETLAVLVHEIADARAALAAARALGADTVLVSAASGAASLGAGWWQAMLRQMAADYPEVQVTAILDCGARADLAQAALRQGLVDICYRGPAAVARKLADIAGQRGARLHRRLPQALDLTGAADREAACRAWLTKKGRRRAAG